MVINLDICSAYACPILPLVLKNLPLTVTSKKATKQPRRKTGVAKARRDARKRRNRK